ncbi:unnamed protein product [Acanthosepion pharaonis]|uniref:Uncharacterized protein n=1 Tax=Acanthosepion pharaonis TaxID=158019 RepID=A0A812D191_ACAPH|nr:unnamed protein product [Sepia pharaonis]
MSFSNLSLLSLFYFFPSCHVSSFLFVSVIHCSSASPLFLHYIFPHNSLPIYPIIHMFSALSLHYIFPIILFPSIPVFSNLSTVPASLHYIFPIILFPSIPVFSNLSTVPASLHYIFPIILFPSIPVFLIYVSTSLLIYLFIFIHCFASLPSLHYIFPIILFHLSQSFLISPLSIHALPSAFHLSHNFFPSIPVFSNLCIHISLSISSSVLFPHAMSLPFVSLSMFLFSALLRGPNMSHVL